MTSPVQAFGAGSLAGKKSGGSRRIKDVGGHWFSAYPNRATNEVRMVADHAKAITGAAWLSHETNVDELQAKGRAA